ncbi:MAG: T9SS type A sorting domain-containing protein [Bacteroidales bacterium]|nr:T9SS type A sorting domain-containing protein [Bacteroidales bacterium]
MRINQFHTTLLLIAMFLTLIPDSLWAQEGDYKMLSIQPEETFQTVVGFGASLAYYENWLTAHPKKSEIYQAIFGELSLDILRVRNAYDYDPSMVDRAREFVEAAELALGHPISVLSTSWGPPGYLKSTNDRKNGGTLKYTTGENGVEFDYPGFAHWWGKSLDEYNANRIYPDYISIQNEPDFSASWETCLFKPSETVNATDTIAGYNKALDAVYDTIMQRDHRPMILGPETVGIGYNAVENYVNALDVTKLDGIAHHLYHGVEENDPYASVNFTKVGEFQPELPHFQSEYSRGDWFSLAGLIYKSFHDEKVVAYLYWDLIWNEGGLVTLDFPWDQSQWIDPQKGYTKTKDFFAFKQFSSFILPGWQMTGHTLTGSDGMALAFVSPAGDSAACVVINRSQTDDLSVHLSIPGYSIDESYIYITSDTENCDLTGSLIDSIFQAPPHSITTVDMRISEYTPVIDHTMVHHFNIFPNPFSHSTIFEFSLNENQGIWLTVVDSQGREVKREFLGHLSPGNHHVTFKRNGLGEGLYFFKLANTRGDGQSGRLIIQN